MKCHCKNFSSQRSNDSFSWVYFLINPTRIKLSEKELELLQMGIFSYGELHHGCSPLWSLGIVKDLDNNDAALKQRNLIQNEINLHM